MYNVYWGWTNLKKTIQDLAKKMFVSTLSFKSFQKSFYSNAIIMISLKLKKRKQSYKPRSAADVRNNIFCIYPTNGA